MPPMRLRPAAGNLTEILKTDRGCLQDLGYDDRSHLVSPSMDLPPAHPVFRHKSSRDVRKARANPWYFSARS